MNRPTPLCFVVLLLLVLVCTSLAAQTARIQRIEVTEYGILSASVTTVQRDAQGILESVLSDVHLVRTTRDIPAQIGTHFGFAFRVVGEPNGTKVTIKKVVIFPPGGLRTASGQEVSRTERMITRTLGGTATYTDYSFDEPWELKPGRWTFELWDGERKLVSQEFNVFKP